ncbi:hypothetical protein ACFFHM_07870 [Halalkalibacter kiskunsagensis]|uniref:Transposase n=1 Tax=Halalkalibacter kiskunsagensis TaxID=1548599 RepID=A0ABV6KAV3_9BACI
MIEANTIELLDERMEVEVLNIIIPQIEVSGTKRASYIHIIANCIIVIQSFFTRENPPKKVGLSVNNVARDYRSKSQTAQSPLRKARFSH